MRVYIMTDMEGVAGVLDHDNWCQPANATYPGRYYDLGREFLTREVNAAIEGLIMGGATEILVADGHGAGGIHPGLLDPRAELLRGWPAGWPGGLDSSFAAIAWIGQHAKAGTCRAHLAHTQWFNYLDLSVNGTSIGEFGQMALCASELGVRPIFGSGDEAFCREAEALTPGIVAVAVKRGTQTDDGHTLDTAAYMRHNLGAIHLHPETARQAIRRGAEQAMRRLHTAPESFAPAPLAPPYERIALFRPDAPGQPIRRDHAQHPDSVIALLNQPFRPQDVV